MAALRRFLLLPRLQLITCVSAASLLILFSRDFRSRMQDERHKRDFNNFSEIPAESAIDPTAIDLTPLVNTLINSSQSGSRQLFSLLSVSSYSSLDLHKLTLLVYNISSMKSLESGLFRRRFCYCVTNDTNDLTDFTAILLDVMGNSTSFLQELFKSSSILSVSQRNNSDCIYICVMAGKTGRELSGVWDDGSVTPLFNQTIVEGPNRVANLSSIRLPVASPHLSRTSSTTLKVTTSVAVTPTSSRPPGFTTGRPSNIRTSQSVSTPQIRTAGAAEATSAGTTRRPASAAAAAMPAITARPPAAAATSAAAATATGVTAAAAAAPPAITARHPAAAATSAAAAAAPPAVTARPPAAAATSAAAATATGVTAAAAAAPPAITARHPAAAATSAAAAAAPPAVTARPPAAAATSAAAATATGVTAAAAAAPPAITARHPAAAATSAAAAAAPPAITARHPAAAATSAAAAAAPPAVTAQPPAAAATSAAAATATGVTAAAAAAPPAVTARHPAAAATSAAAAAAPPAVTAQPPAAAATSAAAATATGVTAAAAAAPPAVTARHPAAAATSAAAATATGVTAATAAAPPAVTARPPAAAATSAATAAAPPAVTPRPPAAAAALKSPDSLVETSISPASPLQTTFTRPSTLRPAGRPAETTPSSRDRTPDRPRETERPGCPWRRPEPGGEAETLGELKLQPCILELCRFFSQCLCRPLSPTRTKRYCDDSFLWYEEHTFEVCRRVKRVSFSRNLKQRCLSKMCNKL